MWLNPADDTGTITGAFAAAGPDASASTPASTAPPTPSPLLGDTDPKQVRRSKALGILANPQQTLDLVRPHRRSAGDAPPVELVETVGSRHSSITAGEPAASSGSQHQGRPATQSRPLRPHDQGSPGLREGWRGSKGSDPSPSTKPNNGSATAPSPSDPSSTSPASPPSTPTKSPTGCVKPSRSCHPGRHLPLRIEHQPQDGPRPHRPVHPDGLDKLDRRCTRSRRKRRRTTRTNPDREPRTHDPTTSPDQNPRPMGSETTLPRHLPLAITPRPTTSSSTTPAPGASVVLS